MGENKLDFTWEVEYFVLGRSNKLRSFVYLGVVRRSDVVPKTSCFFFCYFYSGKELGVDRPTLKQFKKRKEATN